MMLGFIYYKTYHKASLGSKDLITLDPQILSEIMPYEQAQRKVSWINTSNFTLGKSSEYSNIRPYI